MLDIIYKFQEMLYKLLTQDQSLKEKINGVYLTIQQDAKYPYLLINNLKAKSLSLHNKNQYEVEFNILVFSRDSNPLQLMLIGENIAKIITIDSLKSDNFNIINIKAGNFEISPSHDLLTSKLVIGYKMLLR
ncbi:MAG: hypothetical protein K0R02_929 [Rickettsiaceae bacterium]|jgi:hypothetical protein|nr:hypothetical protein [Rickettsiaceae bacterium]